MKAQEFTEKSGGRKLFSGKLMQFTASAMALFAFAGAASPAQAGDFGDAAKQFGINVLFGKGIGQNDPERQGRIYEADRGEVRRTWGEIARGRARTEDQAYLVRVYGSEARASTAAWGLQHCTNTVVMHAQHQQYQYGRQGLNIAPDNSGMRNCLVGRIAQDNPYEALNYIDAKDAADPRAQGRAAVSAYYNQQGQQVPAGVGGPPVSQAELERKIEEQRQTQQPQQQAERPNTLAGRYADRFNKPPSR